MWGMPIWASQELHEAFGYRRVGLSKGVGYKVGRWTESLMMQRMLLMLRRPERAWRLAVQKRMSGPEDAYSRTT